MPIHTKHPYRWEKRGLVITPRPQLSWCRSHCMVPSPDIQPDGTGRIYFSGRDDHNRSHIGWVAVDLNESFRVLDYASEPVLAPGALGCFDDNGVTPSCVIRRADGIYLYYLGWNPGSTVRMHLFGGLAISEDGGRSFRRWSQAPILERCPSDPLLNTAPWVVPTDDGGWRIYYVSGTEWVNRDLPRYLIKTAASSDGRVWQRTGQVAIDYAGPQEMALARPYVIREDGIFKMWFSYKRAEYRMGYAESRDGVAWQRQDDLAGIDVSADGFDSEMLEYAAVVRHNGRRFMFYNGNGYGIGGIGLAIEQPA